MSNFYNKFSLINILIRKEFLKLLIGLGEIIVYLYLIEIEKKSES